MWQRNNKQVQECQDEGRLEWRCFSVALRQLGWKKRGSGLRSAITSEELIRSVGAMCVSICIHACLPTPFSIQASLHLCGPLPPFLSSLPLQTHSYLMMLSNEQPNLQYSTNLAQGNPDTLLSELMQSSLFSVLSP